VNQFADPGFWFHYRTLPEHIRLLADKNFELLKADFRHPSVRLKKIGTIYSAPVGLHYRALAHERTEGLVWFWIGHHSTYDQLLKS
jgi:hypothetical protein